MALVLILWVLDCPPRPPPPSFCLEKDWVSSLLVVCLSVTFRSDSFSLELGDSTPIASFLDDEAGSSNHDGSPPTKKGTHSTANVEAQAIFLAE